MQTSAKTSISLSKLKMLSKASNAPQFAFGANVPTGGLFSFFEVKFAGGFSFGS